MDKATPPQHQFKGLQDWIEVFKAGTHTDSKGRACTFAEGDLDQMVSNLALGAAPAVLGHPKHNDPAYGWVKPEGAKRDGASLFVKFSDVNPDFAKGVDSGAYRNRSVSVVKDKDAGWKLQHIGWLGAAAPAITGLQPLHYSADVDAYEFADQDDFDVALALGDVADLMRGVRDKLIADSGLEAADTAIPSWRIQSIQDTAARLKQSALAEPDDEGGAAQNPNFQQPTAQGGAMSFTQEDIDKAKAEAKAEAEKAAQAQFTAKDGEIAALKQKHRAEAIAAQVGDWTAKGVVTPAESSGLSEFMLAIEEGASGEFNFTAADKSDVKKTPAQFFAEFMARRLPVVKLGGEKAGEAQGTAVDATDGAQLAAAAQTYMKQQSDKGITVSLPAAVAHVAAQAAAQ
jgi:hypothetical protein